MRECEKQLEKLPIRESMEGYHLPEISAQEQGFRQGWREAYKSIRNEILNNSRRASRSSIVTFIDEELNE